MADYAFSLGENLMVALTKYENKMSIQLRKNKKQSTSLDPTSEGVIFQPPHFKVLCSRVPHTIFDVADINLQLEEVNHLKVRDYYVLLNSAQNFILKHSYTSHCGNIIEASVKISTSQWAKMIEKKESVLACFEKFKNLS